MGVPENIDALMAEYDITASTIARAAEVSEAAVSDWRNKGVIPRAHNLDKLCAHFNLSRDDILSDANGFAAKAHGKSSSNWVSVPLFGRIAAGTPLEMDEVENDIEIPAAVYRRHPGGFCLTVEGNSMNNVFPDGGTAYIVPCDDIERDGKPYAVCVNGYDATIKRVRKLANGFELAPDSDDPTYRPKVYDYAEEGTEEITVIGRVVYYMLPFDWEY